MRMAAFALGLILIFSAAHAAFSLSPYLYASEKNLSAEYVSFSSSAANNSTVKLVKISGNAALLLANDRMVTDKTTMHSILYEYYQKNYYASSEEIAEVKAAADSFNKSRNHMTQYGPAEKTCWTSGTFLAHRPCNDLPSCMQTASMVCTITGADGCIVDLLATHILDYKKGVDKLNAAYAKFSEGYSEFSPTTTTAALVKMEASFDEMKTAADMVSKNKLRYEGGCMDCIGRCPKPNFDYAAITSGKAKIAALRTKTAPYATFQQTLDALFLSTSDRVNYRDGEEKAVVFAPKYNVAKERYGSLKAQAVEAKALVSDSDFVSAANSYLDKGDELERKMNTRDFAGFDALLIGYENAGRSLSAMINNSTAPYMAMMEAQDEANDRLIEAMWRVNRLSTSSISTYNALAERKNRLDEKFAPPLSGGQYANLTHEYGLLAADTRIYMSSTATLQDSVFGMGNAFGRASVDGTMSIVGSMVPLSYKTRQSLAHYAPPLVLAVIDLAILSVVLLVFVAAFYHFHGLFRNKIALSGWVLALVGFVFVLLIGSVGFYSIVVATERYTTFSDFYGTLKATDNAAIVIDMSGASDPGKLAMRSCAEQVEAQLKAMGKTRIYKYYLAGSSCSSMTPKNVTNGVINYATTEGLSAPGCLDSMPDMPIIELRHSDSAEVPVFSTVVTKNAIFKGNDAYYGKKPMCDPANVLG